MSWWMFCARSFRTLKWLLQTKIHTHKKGRSRKWKCEKQGTRIMEHGSLFCIIRLRFFSTFCALCPLQLMCVSRQINVKHVHLQSTRTRLWSFGAPYQWKLWFFSVCLTVNVVAFWRNVMSFLEPTNDLLVKQFAKCTFSVVLLFHPKQWKIFKSRVFYS